MRRRALLSSFVTVGLGGFAGCSALSNDLPAGSLRFENQHGFPHIIRLAVRNVGESPDDGAGEVAGETTVPESQRSLTAAASVAPGETQTFESVFADAVWYSIEFTVDGRHPDNDTGRVAYNPAPDDERFARVLSGVVYPDGGFGWEVGSTENTGEFDL